MGQLKKMFTNSVKIATGGEPEEIENKDQGHTLFCWNFNIYWFILRSYARKTI